MMQLLKVSFLACLLVTICGCGGNITGSAPPPQSGGDAQTEQQDPNAGVAIDPSLMSQGAPE